MELQIITNIYVIIKVFKQVFVKFCSSPVSCSLTLPTGNAAGRPTGPGAPHAGGLTAVIGADELSIRAAAVVTVRLMPAASSPSLSQ